MEHRITFEIFGERFYPENVNFVFTDKNSPGDIETTGRFKGEKLNYGSASFTVPDEILSTNPFKYLADTFVPLLDELKRNGAEKWHIDIG